MTERKFWLSSGVHLLKCNSDGWLDVTPDFLRAYYTRPEIHPIDESCPTEIKLFEDLMAEPFADITDARIAQIEDNDAADNYRVLLRFRQALVIAGTLEGAYLELTKPNGPNVPPEFIDQLAHVILRNVLDGVSDPIRLRAGELFFREQNVNNDDGRLLLADTEVVEMHARSGGAGGLGQLLTQTGTPMRSIELDVLGEDNKEVYWGRSDRFDTVIDYRFGQPAVDALARVIEQWIGHFIALDCHVQPKQSFSYEPGDYVIGMDRTATELFNNLVIHQEANTDENRQFVGLYTLEPSDPMAFSERCRGGPIYLGLAKSARNRVRMKPQNLLVNLPLAAD